MWKVFFPKDFKSKVHTTQIKQACEKLPERKKTQRLDRDIAITVEMGGPYLFLTFQYQELEGEEVLYVKNAKWTKTRRKR